MTNSDKQEKILTERHIQTGDRHRAEKKKKHFEKKNKANKRRGQKKEEDVRIERRKGPG